MATWHSNLCYGFGISWTSPFSYYVQCKNL